MVQGLMCRVQNVMVQSLGGLTVEDLGLNGSGLRVEGEDRSVDTCLGFRV